VNNVKMVNPLDSISVATSHQIENDLISVLPWLVLLLALIVSRRKGKNFGYLLCVCLFGAYLYGFLGYTVWRPWPIEFYPGGIEAASVHFVPALFDGDSAFRIQNIQVWGNFLAGVPFGFALPFLVEPHHRTLRRTMACGLGFAIAPEFLQLLWIVFIDSFGGRTVDIDDVWLCFAGTLAGYALLWLLARLYCRIGFSRGARLPIWNHFHEVLVRLGSPSPRTMATIAPSTADQNVAGEAP
jgi:glycopeptide antibiotics resistance protein